MHEYHYGITIREGREKLKMTQAQLAEKWPQPGGGLGGVSVNYVSDVERGIKKITNPRTLRSLVIYYKFHCGKWDSLISIPLNFPKLNKAF